MITEFGKELRKIRIENDEILKDMSDKLGVTVSYLSAVENGKRDIPDNWLEGITMLYDLSSSALEKLKKAEYRTKNKVSIDLDNLNERQKEAVMVFAREFKELSSDDLRKLIQNLKEKKKKEKII